MKKTTKQMVEAQIEVVKNLKTTQEIKAFIESIGCATQQRWGKAVAAIVECGGAGLLCPA